MHKGKKKKITVIGGGTGTYTVLSGLKKYDLDLAAIISMMDSGGSNRIIRDEFGLLPTSDIRQCIVALASEKSHEDLRKLFTYRYESGIGISGMTFGNLFMAALTDIYGSQKKAIKKTCQMLQVKGDILPVTYDDVHLVARYDNGKQVLGEHYIDEPDEALGKQKIVELEVIPKAKANNDAVDAIMDSDLVVLGPGDLFTSIVCNLVIDGIPDAIKKTKAKVLYVVNLMTRFGQTTEFTATDHLETLEKYLGKGSVDFCLINKNGTIPKSVLDRYKEENAYPVEDDLDQRKDIQIIRAKVISNEVYQKPKSDKLQRSLIRHDPDKLARQMMKFV